MASGKMRSASSPNAPKTPSEIASFVSQGRDPAQAEEHEVPDLERGLCEDRERQGPVRRERQRPERVDVRSVLEVDVLHRRHEQDREREDLEGAAEEEETKEEDGRRDLAHGDGDGREHRVDPVAPAAEHLEERLVVALLALGLLVQKLVDGADVFDVRDVREDRQHHDAERQRPPEPESARVDPTEPARQKEARHEQDPEDRAEEHARFPVGVDAPDHPGHADGHPSPLPALVEVDVAPGRHEAAEDERPLEAGEVAEGEDDGEHGVPQRGQRAGYRAPERPADPVEERRARDAHEHRLEPGNERVTAEELREPPDHPVRSPRVMHVVKLRGRAIERVVTHGAPEAPRHHVVPHDPARGDDRPVASADGAEETPRHDEREPDGRDDDDDLRDALHSARRHAGRNLS